MIYQTKARGGHFGPPLEINEGVLWDTILQKGFFETYKIYDHMQKFTEILKFKNFEIVRFCCTLTYENCPNSLNF